MIFQAQVLSFIAFGQERANHNDIKNFGLNWPFLYFSLILRLKSGKIKTNQATFITVTQKVCIVKVVLFLPCEFNKG